MIRVSVKSMVAAELVATGVAAALIPWVDWRIAAGVGMVVGLLVCVVTFRSFAGWQWVRCALCWLCCRNHTATLRAPIDITVDGESVGIVIDGFTITTAIAVHGKAYVPTLLYAEHAETPNIIPISVIAAQMRRHGLAVDVDIICEGRRVVRDNYADLYESFLRGLPVAGQRSITLLVRFDLRSPQVVPGLTWRRDTLAAAVAPARRIARALSQAQCRAQLLTAAQMEAAVAAQLGGTEHVGAGYRDRWTTLRRAGKAYVTSYSLAAVTATDIDNVWTHPSDHTVLVVSLRATDTGIRASAMVRLTTPQPLPATPAGLIPMTARHWDGITLTLPGTARLALPSTPVTEALDGAVVAGASGLLLGRLGDADLLMPVSDPGGPTRIALHADDQTVRQLIRRAAATGERVAVYDPDRRWAMTAGSPGIWTTTDPDATPPRPPTMVVHNGTPNGLHAGARTLVAVGGAPNGATPDIRIEQRGDRITVKTARFATALEGVNYRSEESYLR